MTEARGRRSSRRRLGSAARVIRSANAVHSVLYLVVCFVNATVRWLLVEVEFMARRRLRVYVGAIAVLFRFVVMMLNLSGQEEEKGREGTRRRGGRRRGRRGGRRGGRGRGEGSRVHPTPVSYLRWVDRRDGRTNRTTRGEILYTESARYVRRAGRVLLVARIGAIVLTLKVRIQSRAKRQQAHQQRARDADRAIRRVRGTPRGEGEGRGDRRA